MYVPSILMISTHGYVAAKPRLGQPDTGGQVVYVLELSKALSSLGFKVSILTRGFDDQPESENVADGVDIVRMKYAGSQFRPKEILSDFVPELLTAFFKRAEHLNRYDLVISHYWDGGAAGTEIARRLSLSHAHIPHSLGVLKRQNQAWGSSGESSSDRLDARIKTERAIYHQSQMVVTTTKEQTCCVCEADEYNVPESTIAQIPAGIDQSLFHPLDPLSREARRRALGWNDPTVLCAGRLDVSKGYDLVIQAFPAVLKRIPDAQLLLAVCSETMSHKEQQLLLDLKVLAHRLEIAPSVRFLPCVNQQRLADYYRSADLFVLPSRNEPFGMTAIEAMACGTPTIVTTHGGLWEEMTWGQDCIYCDSLDREAMSQAICSPLMQPSIHKQLARGGAATAAARYTWSQIAVSLLEAASERKMIRMRTRATISLP